MIRNIIKIDQELCNGCGNCVPGCPEGALQIIDGKARLVSDLFCDGLGACLGECPLGAITVEERDAEPYDEGRVMSNIVKQGAGTIRAHLQHLKDHNEDGYLREALGYLRNNGYPVPDGFDTGPASLVMARAHTACPGSMPRDIGRATGGASSPSRVTMQSELSQWPIQLHLVNPMAPYFNNAELLIAADCVPFTLANFHSEFLRGKKLLIFCPKLDQGIDIYIDKLTQLFARQEIPSVTLLHMEVPCCFGVGRIVQEAMKKAGRKIRVDDYTITIGGEVKEEVDTRGAHAR